MLFNKHRILNYKIGKFKVGNHGYLSSYTHTYAEIVYSAKYKNEVFNNLIFTISSDKHRYEVWNKIGGNSTSDEFAYNFALKISEGKFNRMIERLLLEDFKKRMVEYDFKNKFL